MTKLDDEISKVREVRIRKLVAADEKETTLRAIARVVRERDEAHAALEACMQQAVSRGEEP